MRHPWDAADTIVASRNPWLATRNDGHRSTATIASLR
jgi:hypothetical protein